MAVSARLHYTNLSPKFSFHSLSSLLFYIHSLVNAHTKRISHTHTHRFINREKQIHGFSKVMTLICTTCLDLLSGFVASSLAQKLILTHAPSYVTVQQQQSKPLSASEIPSVISNTLGISGSQVIVFL